MPRTLAAMDPTAAARPSPRRGTVRRAGADLVLFLLAAAVTALVTGAVRGDGRPVPVPPDAAGPLRPTTTAGAARAALDRLAVLPRRPDRPGYDRSCGAGAACVFGAPWTDAVDVPLGHNGIDTRTDVVDRDTGPDGVLTDAYSGAVTDRVEVDHVVPLAAAWDLGAAGWPPQRRRAFANDPLELLAVDAAQNQAKSDLTPGDWRTCLRDEGRCRRARPPTWTPRAAIRCAYAQRYVDVCTSYGLPVTADDLAALREMLATCPA